MKSQPNPTPPRREEIREQLIEDFRGLQSDYNNAGHTIPEDCLNPFLEGGMRVFDILTSTLEAREKEAFMAGRRAQNGCTVSIDYNEGGGFAYPTFTDFKNREGK